MTDDEDVLGEAPSMADRLKAEIDGKTKTVSKQQRQRQADQKLVEVKGGVTVYWLAQVFGITSEQVRKKLGSCPALSTSGKGYRYDIATAASYLVNPKVDIEKYLKNMKSADLPAALQKDIWEAKLKRLNWEQQAGELWHTTDVLTVLSGTLSIIKSTIQLWPDTVERQEGLTNEQRLVLVALGDSLQDEMYRTLQDAVAKKTTQPLLVKEGLTSALDEDQDALEDVL